MYTNYVSKGQIPFPGKSLWSTVVPKKKTRKQKPKTTSVIKVAKWNVY